MGFGLFILAVQLIFTLACIWEAKRKGRLNNWWVLAAFALGFFAYIIILMLPPKKS
jgi:hypothetical protein